MQQPLLPLPCLSSARVLFFFRTGKEQRSKCDDDDAEEYCKPYEHLSDPVFRCVVSVFRAVYISVRQCRAVGDRLYNCFTDRADCVSGTP